MEEKKREGRGRQGGRGREGEKEGGREGGGERNLEREREREIQHFLLLSFTVGSGNGKQGSDCSRSVNRDDQGAAEQSSNSWTLKERIKCVSY